MLLVDDLMVGDPPCLKEMVDAYEQTGGNIVAVVEVPREQTRRYGVLDVVVGKRQAGRRPEGSSRSPIRPTRRRP